MRAMIISALLFSAAASGAQAQSNNSTSANIGSTRPEASRYYGGSLNDVPTQRLDQQALRIVRARHAAELINAGKCDKALTYVVARNDDYLAQRVGEVCAAPRS